MLMYGKNHHNTVTILQLKQINFFKKKENHPSKPLLHQVTKAHKGLIPHGQLVVELDGEFKALNRSGKVDQIFHLILPILKPQGQGLSSTTHS